LTEHINTQTAKNSFIEAYRRVTSENDTTYSDTIVDYQGSPTVVRRNITCGTKPHKQQNNTLVLEINAKFVSIF